MARARARSSVRAGSLTELSRRLLARVPTAAYVCAALAFLNAVSWSLLTPPFQAPDEPDHFAYVQELVENDRLPQSNVATGSQEETVVLRAIHQEQIHLGPAVHTIATRGQQRALERELSGPLDRHGAGGAATATSQPPLYYLLQTIPYAIGSSGTILDRLELMRLLSALLGAATALFVFLFLREALPEQPWAWTVGGIGVAVAPLLGFISGAVNPDVLLATVSAALFFCFARAFKRGLTRRRAIVTGAVIAIGFLSKLNFIGLAPGAVLGLILLTVRQARETGPEAYRRLLAPALTLASSPVVLYALANLVSGRPVLGIASDGIDVVTQEASHKLSFIWQLYLPRLPGMHRYFLESFTTRQLWFNGLVGRYGWYDTQFPAWVYKAALVPAALIAGLCLAALVRNRHTVRRRAADLVTYSTMALGVLVLVGAAGYHEAGKTPAAYAEPRYLLPMLAIWGAVLVLAARGAGRRWGPVVGALIVVLLLSHGIFSQLQVISRYYG